MTIRFDDKGKFFTDVISKESIPVTIQTTTHRITGNIHIRPGERLKDTINQSEPFFAITEAAILDQNGEILYEIDFLAVSRDHIVWLAPEDEILTKPEPDAGGNA